MNETLPSLFLIHESNKVTEYIKRPHTMVYERQSVRRSIAQPLTEQENYEEWFQMWLVQPPKQELQIRTHRSGHAALCSSCQFIIRKSPCKNACFENKQCCILSVGSSDVFTLPLLSKLYIPICCHK